MLSAAFDCRRKWTSVYLLIETVRHFLAFFSDYERLINFVEAIPLAICQIFGYLFPFLVIVHIEIFRSTMFSISTVTKVMLMLLLLFLLLLLVAIATVLIVIQNLK